MSVEAGVLSVAMLVKIVIGALVTYLVGLLGWITRTNHTKLQNTLTKKETETLIKDKIQPVEDKIEIKFAMIMDSYKLAAEERTHTKEILQEISTGVAVVKNEVKNLKERLDKEERH